MNYSSTIKSLLTMPDVLGHYGIAVPRSGRIPCPIHNGDGPNCLIRDKSFKCFTCGASGTVLDFVMQYEGVDLSEAERILNEAFHLGLPIGREPTRKELEELERKDRERREARRRHAVEHRRLQDAYDAALAEWTGMDRTLREKAPDGPLDAPDEEWVYALPHIIEAGMRMEAAAERLRVCEKGNK